MADIRQFALGAKLLTLSAASGHIVSDRAPAAEKQRESLNFFWIFPIRKISGTGFCGKKEAVLRGISRVIPVIAGDFGRCAEKGYIMKRMLRVLGWGLGAVLATQPASADDTFQVTPLTAASAHTGWSESSAFRTSSVNWGPAGALLPEQEWKPYVTRPAAFSGSLASLDPARIPVLSKSAASGNRSAGRTTGRASGVRTQAKPRSAPVVAADPCAEKVRLALEEAAKTGKIPASAVPPAAGRTGQNTIPATQTGSQSAPTAATGTNAIKSAVTGQLRQNGETYPYDGGASNVAPGTAAQGQSAPMPELGSGAVPAAPTPFTAAGAQKR